MHFKESDRIKKLIEQNRQRLGQSKEELCSLAKQRFQNKMQVGIDCADLLLIVRCIVVYPYYVRVNLASVYCTVLTYL